jgi:hypothetical protein
LMPRAGSFKQTALKPGRSNWNTVEEKSVFSSAPPCAKYGNVKNVARLRSIPLWRAGRRWANRGEYQLPRPGRTRPWATHAVWLGVGRRTLEVQTGQHARRDLLWLSCAIEVGRHPGLHHEQAVS